MSNWSEHAVAKMIKLSQGNSLREAMREWGTTGGYEDTHSVGEVCELCEHEGLRYQYEIEKRLTRHALWVGSTCITKFVPLYENGFEVVGEEEKSKFLRRTQAAHEARSREERAFGVLEALATAQPDQFEQSSWREKWKMGYSARQLILISAVCNAHKIAFNAADFRINTRRDNVVSQVRTLQPWQYRRLRAALPKTRIAEFDAFFGLNRRK